MKEIFYYYNNLTINFLSILLECFHFIPIIWAKFQVLVHELNRS